MISIALPPKDFDSGRKVWIVKNEESITEIACIFSTKKQAERFKSFLSPNRQYNTWIEEDEVFNSADDLQIDNICNACGESKFMSFANNGSMADGNGLDIIWNCDGCQGVRK